MFAGLRGRLLLSHLLLLLVVLSVISGALLLILSSRPAPPDSTYTELLQFARAINLRELTGGGGGLRNRAAILDGIEAYAAESGVRLLIVTADDRTVVSDTLNEYALGDPITVQLRDANIVGQRLQPLNPEGQPPQLGYALGDFDSPSGEEWLFIGVGLQRENRRGGNNNAVLFAKPRPTTSLISVFSQFGTELAVALLQAGIVGGGTALILAVLISRTVARPLQSLAAAAGAVAEGDYQQRVPESGLREVRDVARAFNRMSEQVELNNQAQRDLLANVSHDLKTPLTSIQGFSQAIMDGAAPNPTHAASIIYEEAGRLTRLVNQLTELARLKAGRLTMRQDRVDLAALVNAMAEKVEVVAQKKQIALHLQVTPVPLVRGDGDRLAQVVTNLLSNAVKYTPIGGEIWAQVGQESAGVRLSIQDNGIGIPQEDISRIFERFYQVDKVRSTATSTRGHGLGLAIVQEIVEAHGGKIQALSDGRGKGSTFSVWLPTAA